MNLNAPFNLSIKLDIMEAQRQKNQNYTCYTYADLVFVSVYGLIKNGPRLLKPIYKSIIAILSNLAPYTKSLCKEGCDGLMYLVQVFAKKEFLLEKEDNCKTLGSLMEAINYLIAYHDETNHYLQIQLMRYQTMFDYFDANIQDIGTMRQVSHQADQQQMVPQQEEEEEEEEIPESGEPEVDLQQIKEEVPEEAQVEQKQEEPVPEQKEEPVE